MIHIALAVCAIAHAAGTQSLSGTHQAVIGLSEQTFEHTTQAATGQTTGSWFVLFSAPDGLPQCPRCEKANSQWEHLAQEQTQHSSFLQFAQVIATAPGSIKLFQRFGVEELPAYLLFRDRKMFRYGGDGSKQDLLAFAADEFRCLRHLHLSHR